MTTAAASWSAMGTRATVQLTGGDHADLIDARWLIERLEERWSRFRATSELNRINERAGHAELVSEDTAALVDDAVAWWRTTGGRFDPTVLRAVQDAGYIRSFDHAPGPIGDGAPVPGCAGVTVDRTTRTVRVPAGIGLDLGGIGKGRAVDTVVDALRTDAAGGVVDLGGDLRVWGEPPAGAPGWPIAVEDVRTGRRAALLGLAAGAVATSTVLRRCWRVGERRAHHLIDPATGRPSDGELLAVTVVAAEATGAEVLAKAALIAGSTPAAAALLEEHGVAGLLFAVDADPVPVGGFERLCWTTAEAA
jgi:thiamine biosynthesis lipoprotein